MKVILVSKSDRRPRDQGKLVGRGETLEVPAISEAKAKARVDNIVLKVDKVEGAH